MTLRDTLKILSIFIIAPVWIFSCSKNTRTEIIDRWENGSKKRIVNYVGEGENEKITEEKLFTANGKLFMRIDRQKNDTTFFPDLQESFSDSTINGLWKIHRHYLDSSGQRLREIGQGSDSLYIKGNNYAHKSITKNLQQINSLTIQESGYLKLDGNGKIWSLPMQKTSVLNYTHVNKVLDEKIDVTAVTKEDLVVKELNKNGRIFLKSSTNYDTYRFDDKSAEKTVTPSYFDTFLKVKKDTLKRIVPIDSTKREVGIYTRVN